MRRLHELIPTLKAHLEGESIRGVTESGLFLAMHAPDIKTLHEQIEGWNKLIGELAATQQSFEGNGIYDRSRNH